ncbi:hypothetical protein M405DRAFT_574119 [Rhizopogon salebrosus TDB-379]|nr:hypothetical protein M405DRAFT_574119 [Rhizopogon salebrosus TDB-379]
MLYHVRMILHISSLLITPPTLIFLVYQCAGVVRSRNPPANLSSHQSSSDGIIGHSVLDAECVTKSTTRSPKQFLRHFSILSTTSGSDSRVCDRRIHGLCNLINNLSWR